MSLTAGSVPHEASRTEDSRTAVGIGNRRAMAANVGGGTLVVNPRAVLLPCGRSVRAPLHKLLAMACRNLRPPRLPCGRGRRILLSQPREEDRRGLHVLRGGWKPRPVPG